MRVALVTGAARGIGAATVAALVADGYRVAAVDSCAGPPLAERAHLDAVVAAGGDSVHPYVLDVRDRAALDAAVADVLARWGRLDAAVAAAAVIRGGRPLWETPSDDLEQLWAVDVLGVWNTAAAAVPAMLSGPDPAGCRFVAVASVAGHGGMFGLSGYCTVKHAVVGMMRALAADLHGTGVTACAVSPGSTDTAMLAATARLYGTTAEELLAHQGIGRALTPEEIAAIIRLACSPAGAAFAGADLDAGGGYRG